MLSAALSCCEYALSRCKGNIAMPLELTPISRAAGLCERYQLRAYDALHLAAAEALMREIGTKNLLWFGFDPAQNAAAVALGLRDGMAG